MYRAVTPNGPLTATTSIRWSVAWTSNVGAGGTFPVLTTPVGVVVSGGTDSGGDQVKTPTLTVNGVDRPQVSTNGSAMAGAPPLARTPLPTRQRRTGWTAPGRGAGDRDRRRVRVPVLLGRVEGTGRGRRPHRSRSVQVISRSDLSTVDVAGDITAIAGANLESVVGERAAVALLPGTLLQRSMVTDADPIPAGNGAGRGGGEGRAAAGGRAGAR